MSMDNPRAVIGDNQAPDHARIVTEQMQRDYAALEESVSSLLDEARGLPAQVDSDETVGTFAKLMKRLRDAAARIEAFRVAEKEPHLRAGQAVDGFFNSLSSKLMRAKRGDRPGAADILQARLDDYQQRKLAEERARRQREAEEQARIAREARERAVREAKEAEEARLAAMRARKPENVESRGAAAAAASERARESAIEASLADTKAEDASFATRAKPADMMRTRIDDALVTMPEEGYAEIIDAAKLDAAKLWPFVTASAKEAALRAWAKTTNHNQQMEGAAIGKRPKTVVR